MLAGEGRNNTRCHSKFAAAVPAQKGGSRAILPLVFIDSVCPRVVCVCECVWMCVCVCVAGRGERKQNREKWERARAGNGKGEGRCEHGKGNGLQGWGFPLVFGAF